MADSVDPNVGVGGNLTVQGTSFMGGNAFANGSMTVQGPLYASVIIVVGPNVFIGQNSGMSITTGQHDNGYGAFTLEFLTTGSDDTAVGYQAMQNYLGSQSTGVGSGALQNGTGDDNTAMGYDAMSNLTTGTQNSAF